MAAHSSVLAWRSPGTGEPGGLPSTGSRRVGHDRSDLAAAAAAREEQHPVSEDCTQSWNLSFRYSIGLAENNDGEIVMTITSI